MHTLTNVDAETATRIFALWDRMADIEAADMDRGQKVLLEGMRRLLAASTAMSLVAVRMTKRKKTDPARGWRPRHVIQLHQDAKSRANIKAAERQYEAGQLDITVVNNLSLAGTWRARRLSELAPPEWFDSAFYQQFYARVGRADGLWVGCPINKDLEMYVGLFRSRRQPAFTPRERDVALLAMRGLKWFLRRYVLSLGLDLARTPLTGMERRVLRHLLNGHTQSSIAESLAQSQHTTHDHIKSIYRKFDVNSRSALTALWLGRS